MPPRKKPPARRKTGTSRGSAPRAQFEVRAKVWLYPRPGGWHFANLSAKHSFEIRERLADERRGFGSLPVTVRIGKTAWRTSIFPDKKAQTYLFAIKAAVRQSEHIVAGDTVRALVQIM